MRGHRVALCLRVRRIHLGRPMMLMSKSPAQELPCRSLIKVTCKRSNCMDVVSAFVKRRDSKERSGVFPRNRKEGHSPQTF